MDPAILAILIRDVLVPEIGAIVRAHHNATGKTPTDDEILAALQVDADRYINVGQAFLARTAPPPV